MQLGRSNSSAGDVRGDGIDDLIIGAHIATPGGRDAAGSTYVVFGTGSGSPPPLRLPPADGATNRASTAGSERLAGNNRADTISGMDGADTIEGDGGRDVLDGGNGGDLVSGERDEDVVQGGQSNDRLFGDQGNDWLSGDRGNDTLTGGPGADRFAYGEGGGHDRIADYELMGGDVIELAVGSDGLLNGIAIAGFQDILARLVDGPDGVFLDLGDGQGITLAGIFKNQLSADDFVIA